MFRYLHILFFLLVIASEAKQSHAQNKTIDSLLTHLNKDKEDTNKVIHLNKLCWEYQSIGNYDTAFRYGNAALQLAQQLNYSKGIATAYSIIGIIYSNQGNYDKSLENYFAALKIREETGDKQGSAASYNNIGTIYFTQGNYNKALENFFAALKTGDKQSVAASYNNIGTTYGAQTNYEKALENFFAALKTGDKYISAASYDNIGIIYYNQGNYGKAFENLFASLKIREETGDKQGIARSYINIANVYTGKLNYADAIAWLQKGLQLSKEIGAKNLVMEAYQGLSAVNEKTSDYHNAYKYHQLYSQIKDSVFNEVSSKQMAELQTKYETEKKDKENELLVQQNLLQQAVIEKRTLVTIILVGLLIFTITVSLLFYNRYRLKQKALMEQELNHQQKLRFKAIIDAEDKERRRIAQELHDGLGQLLSTAKLNISVLEDALPPDETQGIKNALSLLDNAIDEVRTISHNMMPGVLIRLGLISALRELARKISASNKIKVELNADYNERLNEANEVVIYRIIQESVNNMLKHSNASAIVITLHKNKDDLFIEIKDNGIGFDTSLIEKSAGIGWKNIYTRTALLHGSIDVTSAPSKGTTITIHFPQLFAPAL